MSRSLRIAYAVNRFHPSSGGVETHVERLSRELVAAGHQVTILTHDHLPVNHYVMGMRTTTSMYVCRSASS
ncbi:MAG: glycosyltransferase, partial [Actinomycetota bacterium]